MVLLLCGLPSIYQQRISQFGTRQLNCTFAVKKFACYGYKEQHPGDYWKYTIGSTQ